MPYEVVDFGGVHKKWIHHIKRIEIKEYNIICIIIIYICICCVLVWLGIGKINHTLTHTLKAICWYMYSDDIRRPYRVIDQTIWRDVRVGKCVGFTICLATALAARGLNYSKKSISLTMFLFWSRYCVALLDAFDRPLARMRCFRTYDRSFRSETAAAGEFRPRFWSENCAK